MTLSALCILVAVPLRVNASSSPVSWSWKCQRHRVTRSSLSPHSRTTLRRVLSTFWRNSKHSGGHFGFLVSSHCYHHDNVSTKTGPSASWTSTCDSHISIPAQWLSDFWLIGSRKRLFELDFGTFDYASHFCVKRLSLVSFIWMLSSSGNVQKNRDVDESPQRDSDVRLDSSQLMRTDVWSRQSTDPSRWTWKLLHSWKW